MNPEIKELNDKLDFLTAQVGSLTARLKPLDELKEDITLFTNDAFSELIKFLADVDFHFRGEEFVILIKKVLRNVKNLSGLMDQLQSFTELLEDLTPLAKDVFADMLEKFKKLESMVNEIEKLDLNRKKKVSLFSIFKKVRSQEVLRSVDLILDIVKILSKKNIIQKEV